MAVCEIYALAYMNKFASFRLSQAINNTSNGAQYCRWCLLDWVVDIMCRNISISPYWQRRFASFEWNTHFNHTLKRWKAFDWRICFLAERVAQRTLFYGKETFQVGLWQQQCVSLFPLMSFITRRRYCFSYQLHRAVEAQWQRLSEGRHNYDHKNA